MAVENEAFGLTPSAKQRILKVTPDEASKLIAIQLHKQLEIPLHTPPSQLTEDAAYLVGEMLRRWDEYNADLLSAIFTKPSIVTAYRSCAPPIGSIRSQSLDKLQSERFYRFYLPKRAELKSIRERLVLFEKAPQAVSPKDEGVATANTLSSDKAEGAIDKKNVVVVYGRNEKLKNSMFDFLSAVGLRPLDWIQLKTAAIEATGKGTPYIGDIVDTAFGQARAVVVVLTGDDEARLREKFWKEKEPEHETVLTPQARPNVLFEAGMAIGKRDDRTILVEIGRVRQWTDVSGRHVTKLDNTPQKRHELIEELKAVGCEVDVSSPRWMDVGDFAEEPDSQENGRSRQKRITAPERQPVGKETAVGTLNERVNRILDLKNAEEQSEDDWDNCGAFTTDLKGQEITVELPTSGGNFKLYFLWGQETLLGIWYVSILAGKVNMQKELAEVRVIMEKCRQLENDPCTFIIATDDDLSSQSESIQQDFEKKKAFIKQNSRQLFSLEIWDKHGLIQKEKELGILS